MPTPQTAKKPTKQPTKKTAKKPAKRAKTKTPAGPYGAVFEALKKQLSRHEKKLVVVRDEPTYYYLDTKITTPNGKPLFFGAVRTGRSYVSFHLMPVYTHPSLLNGISTPLRRRMQGKSCFNFRVLDSDLIAEIGKLTDRAIEEWKSSGMLG